jgi:hypothetical protein
MVHMTPQITVLVHPIDTVVHPDVPEGFRWAVMVGGAQPHDIDMCAHAGWCPSFSEAAFEGESHGAAAVRALRMFGIPSAYNVLQLPEDPIPAGCSTIHTL